MKKLIALLLALLMVSSAVIAVSAEGTGEVVPTAPTIFAQTEPVKEGDEVVAYNVRFLAAVHETTGDAIGFEVVAKFSDKEVEYSKAEGDTAMEGTTLYENVRVKGVSEPVTKYDADAIGMFAAGINGVPTNLDIVFEIKAYISYGEGLKVETGVMTAQYANGKILSMTGADVYTQDFNAATSNTALLTAAGITQPYGKAMVPTLAGDRLNIPWTDWNSDANGVNCFFGLVPRDPFATAWTENNGAEYNYMVEMDVNISELSSFGLFLNGTQNSTDDTKANYRKDTVFVSFRATENDFTEGKNGVGTFTSGTISSMMTDKTETTDDERDVFCIRTTEYNSNGANTKSHRDYKVEYDELTFATKNANVSFKLTVVVNNTHASGCQIGVFVNENYIQSYEVADSYSVTANSYISVWAQKTIMSIDNINVSKINGDIELDSANKTGTIPTDVTPMYEQGFDATNYENSLEGVGVGHSYVNSTCPTCGLPLTINDAKQLQISSHAWHSDPDYFANVVSADEVNGAELYKFEADIAISSITNVFALTLNNKQDNDNSLSGANKYLKNALMIRFFMDNTSGNLTELQVVEASAAAGTGTTNGAVLSEKYTVTDVSAKNGFKFSVIVDNSVADTCTLYLFINGELVGTYSAEAREHTYTDKNGKSQTTTLDPNVAESSTIGVFAQAAVATIDNIKVTGVKKNS